MVSSQIKNKIPQLLKDAGLTISDLQRRSGLSYPATHNIANKKALIISDDTKVGTLRAVCEALGVDFNDIVEVEIISEV